MTAVSAAEAVDCLVGVADDAQVGSAGRQQFEEARLSRVDILVLVHGNPAVSGAEHRPRGGAPGQKLDAAGDQVVKVERVGRRERGIVSRGSALATGSSISSGPSS